MKTKKTLCPSEMSILPYTSVYIDAETHHFMEAVKESTKHYNQRGKFVHYLQHRFTTTDNSNNVLPCLSVRTGFDLFLTVKGYPPGSEVIMSAINIPDMVQIVQHHGLKVVALDISIETTKVKSSLLQSLITKRTVAVVIAHVFGKWCNIDDVISICHAHSVDVIEDCAEGFCGFTHLGNKGTDISLFSFGVIKTATAFGGAIAKVKDIPTYNRMVELYATYPIQSQNEYAKKVMKYFLAYMFLDCPRLIKPGMHFLKAINFDYKSYFVTVLRGFPNEMIKKIRQQPSTALLVMMRKRLVNWSQEDYEMVNIKAEYFRKQLPRGIALVGMQSDVNNYWLFPVLMNEPDRCVRLLNSMGVDAYRGATQLNLVIDTTAIDTVNPDSKQTSTSNSIQCNPKHSSQSLINQDTRNITLPNYPNIDYMSSLPPLVNDRTSISNSDKCVVDLRNDKSPIHLKSEHNVISSTVIVNDVMQSIYSETKTDLKSSMDPLLNLTSEPKLECQSSINSDLNMNVHPKVHNEVEIHSHELQSHCDNAADPKEARYLIDHVVYLPINRSVPYHVLDQMSQRFRTALTLLNGEKVKCLSKL